MEQPLTGDIPEDGSALSIAAYEKSGGYQALRQVLAGIDPEDAIQVVIDSNLRGRGGAGFPTGKKWSFMRDAKTEEATRYLIVNADEMEPGTFKDRALLEGNPHLLLEGAILAAYAIEANISYIFLRWAYKTSAKRLQVAINEAYDAGYLGKNILNSDFSLEMYLHISAGRYMCGEETGQLNSLEGKRAIPRAKPPYPGISGLWGKPTVVDNVETLCNIPHIIRRGAEWFNSLSHIQNDGGTKLYGVSGKVKRPGLWELPMGTTIREILEDHAGGMRDGLKFRALIPGGASTEFVLEEHLDTPMDFDSMQTVGSRLGTGTMIVLDDHTCPVALVHNLEHFFAQESCGWCTPCREGLPWTEKILKALDEGEGQPGDLERLERLTRLLGPGHTFCALAPGAMEPLQSALKYFREDFEQHIHLHSCPWRS